jgi:murein DD-endopeptidase / murein LD-carboxypeptidase
MILKPKHVLVSAMLLLSSSLVSFAQKKGKAPSHGAESDVRFIDDIEVNAGSGEIVSTVSKKNETVSQKKAVPVTVSYLENDIEKATALELKYALLLNTEVESVRNTKLFQFIDEWFGTPYHLGGTDKNGIDCSAFVQMVSIGVFSVNLPRTSREQYSYVSTIDPSELQEGDLVFFSSGHNISHVGIYLQNNKFVHASTSEGVTISDLGDSYWARRFAGAGRYNVATTQCSSKP